MSGLLTPYDADICNSAKLRVIVTRPAGQLPPQNGAQPPAQTRNGQNGVVRRPLRFQFPPNIINDSRDSDWKEESSGPNGGDKIGIYECANPRRITLEWSFIVGFAGWTTAMIKDELKMLRGYFRNPFIDGVGANASSPLIIELLLWDVGGDSLMTFRMKGVTIKHGKTLVGQRPSSIFPLRTDVTTDFLSYPLIGTPPAHVVPGQRPFGVDWF